MYYTVIHSLSYVARSNMDGTNAIKVVYGDHVRSPDGLAIDFLSKYNQTSLKRGSKTLGLDNNPRVIEVLELAIFEDIEKLKGKYRDNNNITSCFGLSGY